MLMIRRKILIRVHPCLEENIGIILNKHLVSYDKEYFRTTYRNKEIVRVCYNGSVIADRLDDFIEDLKTVRGFVSLTY